ncbi:MAG: DNA polymerase I [Nitrospira sp.]|nr:DNA polymerase I [Nitrospira sp.]
MVSSTADKRPTLYLIDGSAYIYRAFFALPPLSNSKGLQTNAIYGFATMLLKILRERQPDGIAVAFDEKGPTLRHEEFKAYKAQRPPMPDAMQAQIPYIHRLVDALDIPVLRQSGYEADDVIGTLARKAEQAGYDVVIVTGDKDMFQLLSPHIHIYDPVKDKWFGETECRERFGVEPGRVVEIMGLMGDATDNIPGVKGIGEKTATRLIAQFGTIEELFNRIDEVTPARIKTLLTEQADQARLSRNLATIKTDCPIEFDRSALRVKPPHIDRLNALLRELEFTSLLKSSPASDEPLGTERPAVVHIESEQAARAFVDSLPREAPLAVRCLLAGESPLRADVQGIALSTGDRTAYIPIDIHGYMRPITALLHESTRTKATHDLKTTLLAFHRIGITLAAPYFDTMVADYLLHPNRRDHQLDTLAMELLNHRLGGTDKQRAGSASLFEHGSASSEQAAESASVIAKITPILTNQLRDQGALKLFQDVEMPLVPVLTEIERNGFLVDLEVLRTLSNELERELDRMMQTIAHLAGGEFNINSPKQLATVLFDKLKLKPIRKTKTGYSTDEDTLTQLATQHELPAQILSYRSLSKLKSTYVDALPELIHPETKRLHTSLNQTVAATGRLSSTDPNLQNIPVKGDYGLRIREAFIAPKGHHLLCADYSQIEPRILAHLSQDQRLLAIFAQGEDIHTATAMEIFDRPAGQITREMRRAAKTVVFGIVYGISPFGLSQSIGVSQTDAKQYIDTFFAKFPAVRALMDRNIAEAREKGYTTTILGRRRPIPELQSNDPAQRGFGERMAVNSPIQGSAADLIKVAMINVHRALHRELPHVKMILQVHDELIFEVPDHDLDETKRLVKHEMEAVGTQLGLSVPLKVDLGVGKNWRVAHP